MYVYIYLYVYTHIAHTKKDQKKSELYFSVAMYLELTNTTVDDLNYVQTPFGEKQSILQHPIDLLPKRLA